MHILSIIYTEKSLILHFSITNITLHKACCNTCTYCQELILYNSTRIYIYIGCLYGYNYDRKLVFHEKTLLDKRTYYFHIRFTLKKLLYIYIRMFLVLCHWLSTEMCSSLSLHFISYF